MKHLFSIMLCIVLFAACSDSDDAPQTIVLDKGTATEQTIYADQTSNNDGISFYAAEPWTASVREVASRAADRVDWIELSQYSGNAGNFTLKLTIAPNTTGADRKAEIRIEAGDAVITITIEQKGITQEEAEQQKPDQPVNPDQPKTAVISSITAEITDSYGNQTTKVDFFYDAQGRLTRYVEEDTTEHEPLPNETRILGDPEETQIEYTKTGDDQHDVIYLRSSKSSALIAESLHLDREGRVYTVDFRDNDDCADLTYNELGELILTDESYELQGGHQGPDGEFIPDTEPYLHEVKRYMTWTDGNITRCKWINDRDGWTSEILYSTIENNTNLDLASMIFQMSGDEGVAFMRGTEYGTMLDCFGRRTKNLPKEIISEYGCTIDYTLDNEGRVKTIVIKSEYGTDRYQITYK